MRVWLAASQPAGDVLESDLDRLFVLVVQSGRVTLPLRPRGAIGLPAERRQGTGSGGWCEPTTQITRSPTSAILALASSAVTTELAFGERGRWLIRGIVVAVVDTDAGAGGALK